MAKRYTAIDQGEANCILCQLCVRTCNEIVGAQAIGIAERGLHKKVLSPFNIAEEKVRTVYEGVEGCYRPRTEEQTMSVLSTLGLHHKQYVLL